MSDLFDHYSSTFIVHTIHHTRIHVFVFLVSKRSMADEAMKLRDVVINAKDITNPTR